MTIASSFMSRLAKPALLLRSSTCGSAIFFPPIEIAMRLRSSLAGDELLPAVDVVGCVRARRVGPLWLTLGEEGGGCGAHAFLRVASRATRTRSWPRAA